MDKQNIAHKIIELITEKLGIHNPEQRPEAAFIKDLHVDSLDLFELMIDVEKEFHITIQPEEADKIITIHNLIEYVAKSLLQV